MGDIRYLSGGLDIHIPFLYRIVPSSFFLAVISGSLSLHLVRALRLRFIGMRGDVDSAEFMLRLRILIFLRHIGAPIHKIPEPLPAV